MLAPNIFSKCIWILSVLNCAISIPILENDEGYIIDSRMNNYRKRFAILAENIDQKYVANLQDLINLFNVAFDANDLRRNEYLLENFLAKLDAEFAVYLQYQMDAQHLNQDINMEKWFLEQLLKQLDDTVLAADIRAILPLYEESKRAKTIDERFEHFANINNEIPNRLLDYFEADPTPISILNVQLQYFHEFLDYLLQEGMVGDFESEIKSLLSEVDRAMSGDVSYEEKSRLIDLFDRVDTKFERFLDAKAHEFELWKFGL